MMVLVLTACPPGLRGVLTRWLMEISPGVFVGQPSRRVREQLWLRVATDLKTGKAILVTSARNEQGLDFQVLGHDWEPVDYEGVMLMRRPTGGGAPGPHSAASGSRPTGWSSASRRRRFGSH